MGVRILTAFQSDEAVGRAARYLPGRTFPSMTSLPAYFAARHSVEQLSATGGETRRVGQRYQRWDGLRWVEQG